MDPGTLPAPPVRLGDTANAPINIKKEAQEDVKINLAPAEDDDMFDEVDGPEYVDLSYEGLAEVNGVPHFVCESPSPKMATRETIINTKRRLQDSADSWSQDFNQACFKPLW